MEFVSKVWTDPLFTGMAQANQLRVDGGVFHLTHRCHNRAFLLKVARDRDAYRAKGREHLRQFDVSQKVSPISVTPFRLRDKTSRGRAASLRSRPRRSQVRLNFDALCCRRSLSARP